MKRHDRQINRLSKLMSYILRHRPDEFGLVLDEEGFIGLKELLKAINEEPGWTYVRLSHIKEVVLHAERPRFEIVENRIRATYGHSLPSPISYPPAEPPKVLYHGTRRRAYPAIAAYGLRPMERQYVHLTTSEELAIRIGRRRDNDPLLLTIRAMEAYEDGIVFYRANQLIYLVKELPYRYITGPPLPKGAPAETDRKKREERHAPPPLPGSFFPDIATEIERLGRPGKKDRRRPRRRGRKYNA